jgi:hypothetical protein
VSSKLSSVGGREWLKHNNVERLKRVSRVGWKHCKQYTIGLAVVEKIHREMAAMAVNDEETPRSPATRFLLRAAVENLL